MLELSLLKFWQYLALIHPLLNSIPRNRDSRTHSYLSFDSYNLTWDVWICNSKLKISCELDDFVSRSSEQCIFLPYLSTTFRLLAALYFFATSNTDFLGWCHGPYLVSVLALEWTDGQVTFDKRWHLFRPALKYDKTAREHLITDDIWWQM